MLNQERIRLMTELAAYEQAEGKADAPVERYYRRDYVGLQMMKTLLYATIAFAILFLLQLLYQMESWIDSLYGMDYQEYIMGILIKYLVFVVVYQGIAWGVYNLRYRKAQKNRKMCQNRLKKIEKLYEKEEKLLPMEEWED